MIPAHIVGPAGVFPTSGERERAGRKRIEHGLC